MKALAIQGSFGLDNLTLVDRPEPRPGTGQVLLKMKAASLNYRDLLTVMGAYNPKQPLPLIPCSDGVGVVVATGDGVTRLQVGDRVCPIFCQDWLSGRPTREKLRSTLGGPLDGTLTELMVVSEESAVQVPAHLSDTEAAALPCAAVTAWTALVTEGQLKAGDTVLVQGTGGVSLFALQIAKLFGARVILTSKSDAKLERARELGADETINYADDPKWSKAVRRHTGGQGVDHVVEVGGAGTLDQSLRSVAMGGRIHVIGVLAGVKTDVMLTSLLMQYVRLQGILVGHRESFEALCRAMAQHQLRPVLDETFSLAETRQGFDRMAAGEHFGKITVHISESHRRLPGA